jgi:Tol biopolymer transport system component
MKTFKLLILILVAFLFVDCEESYFDFTQSDSKILFLSRRTENSADWSLMIMNSDGTDQKEITNLDVRYGKPVLSHSGKSILFLHNDSLYNYELYSVDIDGSNLMLVDKSDDSFASACWSKDDSKIIYSKKDIIKYDVVSGNREVLTSGGSNKYPVCSKDNTIYYTHNGSSEDNGIYKMDFDGSNKKFLIKNALYPSLSPNEKKILYLSEIENGSSQIFVANSDGSVQKQLTSSYSSWTTWTPVGNHEPFWSPDGKKIVYVSYEDDLPEIKIMNCDGQTR